MKPLSPPNITGIFPNVISISSNFPILVHVFGLGYVPSIVCTIKIDNKTIIGSFISAREITFTVNPGDFLVPKTTMLYASNDGVTFTLLGIPFYINQGTVVLEDLFDTAILSSSSWMYNFTATISATCSWNGSSLYFGSTSAYVYTVELDFSNGGSISFMASWCSS